MTAEELDSWIANKTGNPMSSVFQEYGISDVSFQIVNSRRQKIHRHPLFQCVSLLQQQNDVAGKSPAEVGVMLMGSIPVACQYVTLQALRNVARFPIPMANAAERKRLYLEFMDSVQADIPSKDVFIPSIVWTAMVQMLGGGNTDTEFGEFAVILTAMAKGSTERMNPQIVAQLANYFEFDSKRSDVVNRYYAEWYGYGLNKQVVLAAYCIGAECAAYDSLMQSGSTPSIDGICAYMDEIAKVIEYWMRPSPGQRWMKQQEGVVRAMVMSDEYFRKVLSYNERGPFIEAIIRRYPEGSTITRQNVIDELFYEKILRQANAGMLEGFNLSTFIQEYKGMKGSPKKYSDYYAEMTELANRYGIPVKIGAPGWWDLLLKKAWDAAAKDMKDGIAAVYNLAVARASFQAGRVAALLRETQLESDKAIMTAAIFNVMLSGEYVLGERETDDQIRLEFNNIRAKNAAAAEIERVRSNQRRNNEMRQPPRQQPTQLENVAWKSGVAVTFAPGFILPQRQESKPRAKKGKPDPTPSEPIELQVDPLTSPRKFNFEE